MKKRKLNYEQLANLLLNYILENLNMDGLEIVELLLEGGFTNDDLFKLGFDNDDIELAQERINEGLVK